MMKTQLISDDPEITTSKRRHNGIPQSLVFAAVSLESVFCTHRMIYLEFFNFTQPEVFYQDAILWKFLSIDFVGPWHSFLSFTFEDKTFE